MVRAVTFGDDMLFFLTLVAAAQASDELLPWMRNCRVYSEKSAWYPKLMEARRRVNAAGLAWDDATCTVTIPESLAMYGFCDVDTSGPDRGIGDVVPRETCVIDARIDRLSGLSALVARAEAAAREANERAAGAERESRLAREEAAGASRAAGEAERQAGEAADAAEEARLSAEASAHDLVDAREEARLARVAAEEARRLAEEATQSAERAEASATRARRAGGYLLVQGGGAVFVRNAVSVPYGADGPLPEGYNPSELVRNRIIRTQAAVGTTVGVDVGFAWPSVQFGLALNGLWSSEKIENDAFETLSENGFGAAADLHAEFGSGMWKFGGGPSVAVTMVGQDLGATPAVSGVVAGGMLEVRYLATNDRLWQLIAVQLRAGDETHNTMLDGYEQTFHAPWVSISLLVGIGGGPEVNTQAQAKKEGVE